MAGEEFWAVGLVVVMFLGMGIIAFFRETASGKRMGRAIVDMAVSWIGGLERKPEKTKDSAIKSGERELVEERLSFLESEVGSLRENIDFLQKLLEKKDERALPLNPKQGQGG